MGFFSCDRTSVWKVLLNPGLLQSDRSRMQDRLPYLSPTHVEASVFLVFLCKIPWWRDVDQVWSVIVCLSCVEFRLYCVNKTRLSGGNVSTEIRPSFTCGFCVWFGQVGRLGGGPPTSWIVLWPCVCVCPSPIPTTRRVPGPLVRLPTALWFPTYCGHHQNRTTCCQRWVPSEVWRITQVLVRDRALQFPVCLSDVEVDTSWKRSSSVALFQRRNHIGQRTLTVDVELQFSTAHGGRCSDWVV